MKTGSEVVHFCRDRTFTLGEIFLIGRCDACKRTVEILFIRGEAARLACPICGAPAVSAETRTWSRS